MAKLYIFGIGGTGARVLRSFTMLMAAGVKLGCNEVVPIIIDPDAANGNLSSTVAAMNNYMAIKSHLHPNNGSDFFRSDLTRILPNYTLQINNTNDKTFKQFIGLSTMNKESKAMMRMLFSEKNLSSPMKVGFKGNPNIGSVVLNQIVNSPGLTDFATNFSQGDKIFIISSIFGGTGASGFPLLLKTLRKDKSLPNFDIINKSEIGAITILPYFKLKNNDESEIDSSTFISKTKSALAYYENNISNNNSINALYYLADDVYNTYENNEGGSDQKNAAHLIEFLAATAIVDFTNNYTLEQTGNINTVHKELGINDITDSVSFDSLDYSLQAMLFKPLTQFIMMSNCLTYKKSYYHSESFAANKDNFNGLYGTLFIKELEDYCRLYIEWLNEMKNNKRSLDLFNLNQSDKPFDIVTNRRAKRIYSLKSDYDLVTARLNKAVHQCKSNHKEDKFLEMFFLGTDRLTKEKF